MKKLVALLLCLTILAPMTALADDAFYLIFSVLSSEEILGDPGYAGELDSEGSKTCILSVDFAESAVMLFGDNGNGKVDAAVWNDVDTGKLLVILSYYAEHYKETDDLDPDLFVIGIKFEEDGDFIYVTNEEDAKALYDIFQSV